MIKQTEREIGSSSPDPVNSLKLIRILVVGTTKVNSGTAERKMTTDHSLNSYYLRMFDVRLTDTFPCVFLCLAEVSNVKNIRIRNFRCFHAMQSVPLAPLTLLVGENSTGKTSFMAAIHAMNGIMMGQSLPSLWGAPFNFGNFNQIAFDGETGEIDMGFDLEVHGDKDDLQCDFVIGSVDSSPSPFSAHIRHADVSASIKPEISEKNLPSFVIEIPKDKRRANFPFYDRTDSHRIKFPFAVSHAWDFHLMNLINLALTTLIDGEPLFALDPDGISNEERGLLQSFQGITKTFNNSFSSHANAPTRSKPQRTYDLILSAYDSEGANIMVYLAELSRNNEETWVSIQEFIQRFGRSAGLFEEIKIRNFGGGKDDPFQVLVKEYTKDGSGKFQNIIDVGYGVNQIIPVVAELFRLSYIDVFLLQQPEIHLHPSAQAAMGSLLCQFASERRQMVVETHSDHLLDRIRMDIRDGKSRLTNEDVLLLFFERDGPEAKIHPVRYDDMGNVIGAPATYRQFFMEETNRSIGW